ncbi:TPA: sugar transferase [bacterium]|nr:sugar transferase [bacterium]
MVIKRIFDLILSFFGIIIALPIFIFIPILNILSGSKVFFIQERIGKNHKPFKLIKFATMVENAHIIGGTLIHPNDSRVTKVGAILRKTKINEIPQLINVLKGDMSFVGPRPLPKKELSIYKQNFAKKIYTMKPGITGLGSLYFYNEEMLLPNDKEIAEAFFKRVIIPHKVELELWYAEHRNFILDIKIFIATLLLVFMPSHLILSYISKKLSGSKVKEKANDIIKMQKDLMNKTNGKIEEKKILAKEEN